MRTTFLTRRPSATAAETLRPMLESLLGPDLPLAIRAWDGSRVGPSDAKTTLVLRSPQALRRLVWAPGELGLGRAYVSGDLDIEGDIFEFLSIREHFRDTDPAAVDFTFGPRQWAHAAKAALQLGAIGLPVAPPVEEARIHGRVHSRERDAAAIAHHYDVSNDFYRAFLGDTMTYSCAYFAQEDFNLDDAQRAKYELVCRKLDLQPGMRLLDVGSGWGGMVIHAAQHHGVHAVGVTVSRQQADLARERVAAAGLSDRVQIRLEDYRDVRDGPYDAISSIGMFEHVGLSKLGPYFEDLFQLLKPGGRLLNHGITSPQQWGSFDNRSFIQRYVFPDGQLHEIGRVQSEMQKRGFEVRDVEGLREHYARTLRHWVANLENHWDEAVALTTPGRARVWRLYMAASAVNFEDGGIGIHQVLAVKRDEHGASGMPPTRASFTVPPSP